MKEIKDFKTIGFIGTGNLGRHAIERLAPNFKIFAFDPVESEEVTNLGAQYTDIKEVIESSEVIFLTVKPNIADEVNSTISNFLSSQLLISFVAGLKFEKLKNQFNGYENIYRAMPTLGISSGSSPIAMYTESKTNQSSVINLLGLLGRCIQIEEDQFDAFTAIFGAGPAYISHLSDTLSDIARKHGFNNPESWIRDLLDGTSFIHKSNEKSKGFKDIKTMVASKGGVTEAALAKIDASGIKKIWQDAINEAIDKSKSLGE